MLNTSNSLMPLSKTGAGTQPTIRKEEYVENLKLKNGEIAKFIRFDDWQRPIYQLESGINVCCVNLDGTYLHTISTGSGEPCSPLVEDFQPV